MNDNNLVSNENSVETIETDYSKMGFLKRVIGIIGYPSKVMKSLAQKPRVLFGIILSAITPAILILATFPMYREYTSNLLKATYAKMNIEMTPEQLEQTLNISQYSAVISAPITAIIMLLIEALILWAIIKLFKGDGKFKHVLSVLGYTAIITTLATIVNIITTRLTGTFTDVSYTSLASLIPSMKGSFIYGVAKVIEVFSIWQYIVIGIGLSAISKLSNKKVIIIVACIFAILAVYSGVSELNMGL